ncbi:MAG TPA: metallophosphoesterase [Nitrospinota bacterium]|jgi:hypothetical protein|nr:metallophosphoesterase [Nitrospinota bacterium]|tara:strand:+ start:71359 stop:71847 length:489 start_codon:yes stop_codon:yes gene_type:complete
MRLGVISDTHDNVPCIERSVEIFNSNNVNAVLHCGDFVAPFALLPFIRLRHPLYAVFGNNDCDKLGLQKLFEHQNWVLRERPSFFAFNGKSIAMLHEPENLVKITESGQYDLVVYGHTHKKFIEKNGKTTILNPGEGCGCAGGVATAAIIDLPSGECEFFTL